MLFTPMIAYVQSFDPSQPVLCLRGYEYWLQFVFLIQFRY